MAEWDVESCTYGQEEQKVCVIIFPLVTEHFGSNDPKACATSYDLGLRIHFSQYTPNLDQLSHIHISLSYHFC